VKRHDREALIVIAVVVLFFTVCVAIAISTATR
jgi:hypothetical protein